MQNYKTYLKNQHFGVEKFNFSLSSIVFQQESKKIKNLHVSNLFFIFASVIKTMLMWEFLSLIVTLITMPLFIKAGDWCWQTCFIYFGLCMACTPIGGIPIYLLISRRQSLKTLSFRIRLSMIIFAQRYQRWLLQVINSANTNYFAKYLFFNVFIFTFAKYQRNLSLFQVEIYSCSQYLSVYYRNIRVTQGNCNFLVKFCMNYLAVPNNLLLSLIIVLPTYY